MDSVLHVTHAEAMNTTLGPSALLLGVLITTVALAQVPVNRAAVEREATAVGEAYLDLVDAGQYDEAIARHTAGAAMEPLFRAAFEARKPRGKLSNRTVHAVTGRGGDVEITYHYVPEFPEKTMRGALKTHVETLALIRRASDGRVFITIHRVGG